MSNGDGMNINATKYLFLARNLGYAFSESDKQIATIIILNLNIHDERIAYISPKTNDDTINHIVINMTSVVISLG